MTSSKEKSKKPKDRRQKEMFKDKPLPDEKVVHPYTQGTGDNCSF